MTQANLTTPDPLRLDAEVSSLARILAAAYASLVAWHRQDLEERGDDAVPQVGALDDPEYQRQAIDAPADELSWMSLRPLIEADPEAGWEAWERVKAEAREELASEHRAAVALCWNDSPWQRARFLAIRQAFIDEWHPRGGIELTLIDQMAQAHSLYLQWDARCAARSFRAGPVPTTGRLR